MKTRTGNWFLTYTGKQFYPLDPHPDDICIEDIAHALSLVNRFGGHTREAYSVGQHSLIVSDALPEPLKLVGLMHDATEAYLGDMVRPLKLDMPHYRDIEDKLWVIISDKFGLPFVMPQEVKTEDNRALMTERRDLLVKTDHDWGFLESFKPYDFTITPLWPRVIKDLFLAEFKRLTNS